jgi:hypothetical protein
MIDAFYVRHALATALRMARFDRTAIADFDQSYEGFFRSFYGILLCAPIYAVILIAERRLAADPNAELSELTLARLPPPSLALYALEALTYLVSWLAFPLAMILMVRLLGATRRYVPLIVAYNWSSCILLAAMALPWLLYLSGVVSVTGVAALYAAVWTFGFIYRWIVAREGLQTSGLTAAGIAIFDYLLGLLILYGASRLRARL